MIGPLIATIPTVEHPTSTLRNANMFPTTLLALATVLLLGLVFVCPPTDRATVPVEK